MINAQFGGEAYSIEKETRYTMDNLASAESELRQYTSPFADATEIFEPVGKQMCGTVLLALGFTFELIGCIVSVCGPQ